MLRQLHSHRITERRIMRLFTVGLPPAGRSQLFNTLNICDKCARAYQKHQYLESGLLGTRDPITHFTLERVEAAVLDATTSKERRRTSLFSKWSLAAVGAVAVALLALFLVPAVPSSDRAALAPDARFVPIDLVARGRIPDKTSMVGIRVLKVAEPDEVEETASLSIDDIITFTYTRAAQQAGYLTIFGIQQSGELLWYYPDYGEKQSIETPGDVVDEPLGEGIKLSVNHEPGWLRIVSIFSTEPIVVDKIEATIEESRRKSGTFRSLEPLAPETIGQTSIEYSILIHINGKDK